MIKNISVSVINSRLPMYRVYYGFGDVICGLFTRIAPKVMPLAKQLLMKAIGVIRDKSIGTVGDLTGTAFSTIKGRINVVLDEQQQQTIVSSMIAGSALCFIR